MHNGYKWKKYVHWLHMDKKDTDLKCGFNEGRLKVLDIHCSHTSKQSTRSVLQRGSVGDVQVHGCIFPYQYRVSVTSR